VGGDYVIKEGCSQENWRVQSVDAIGAVESERAYQVASQWRTGFVPAAYPYKKGGWRASAVDCNPNPHSSSDSYCHIAITIDTMFSSSNISHNEHAQLLIQSLKDTLNGQPFTTSTTAHQYPLTHHPLIDTFASAEAKQAAERSLAALYQPTYGSSTVQEHNNRVLGGYRATLANPNVSDAAKAHARAMLAQAGADPRTQRAVAAQNSQATSGQDTHLARQLGGYKSALKSESRSPVFEKVQKF